jgi:hypothetical protein
VSWPVARESNDDDIVVARRFIIIEEAIFIESSLQINELFGKRPCFDDGTSDEKEEEEEEEETANSSSSMKLFAADICHSRSSEFEYFKRRWRTRRAVDRVIQRGPPIASM